MYSNNYFTHCQQCTPETGRKPACHQTCELYKQDKLKYDIDKLAEDKNKYNSRNIESACIDGINRMKSENVKGPKISVIKSPKNKFKKI